VPADLDDRLRRALALERGPGARTGALGELTSRLGRRRARRRVALGGLAAAVVVAGGLAVGFAATVPGRPVVNAAPPGSTGVNRTPTAAPVARCVQVQVGSGTPACAGSIGGAPSAEFGPLESKAAAAQPPIEIQTLRARVGQRLEVILPVLPGVSWGSVTLRPESATPGRTRTLPAQFRPAGGHTVVVLDHAPAGRFALVAHGFAACPSPPNPGCEVVPEQWSVQLYVSHDKGGTR